MINVPDPEQLEKFSELIDASLAASPKNLCIWHAHCVDGFGAATVVNKYYKKQKDVCEFHAGVYNDPPPDVTGKHVCLVDFSYTREIVQQMLETAASVTIIDHHKSAIENLTGLVHPKLQLVFSDEHSGAVLTWKYLFPYLDVPKLLLHIEDRDMWRFEMPGTPEIIAALYSYELDFDAWEPLTAEGLYLDGVAVLRAHNKLVTNLTRQSPQRHLIGGHEVPVHNAGRDLSSDVGNIMARGYPFSATYYDTDEHRVFSLRSSATGIDVSEIAKLYGGGGHKHAAGFRISLAEVAKTQLKWD